MRGRAIWIVCAVPAILLALELGTWLIYHHPRLLPADRTDPIFIAFRQLYLTELSLIQWEPACSQYSDVVGNHTLRPGRCTHASSEFSVEVEANSMGLRDTEAALDAPEVIVIGASFAMGWGVDQDDVIARHVERLTGLRVLNAAVAGYGLRQSLSLLQKLDRSRLRYLVISYFLPVDTRNIRQTLAQNEPANDYRLDRQAYDNVVQRYVADRKPIAFGTYFFRLARTFLTMPADRWRFERATESERIPASFVEPAGAELLEMLRRAASTIGNSTIVVAPGTPACRRTGDQVGKSITDALEAGMKKIDNRVLAVAAGAELDPSYCFPLDNHLNARGHLLYGRKIAEAILRDMQLDPGRR